MKNSGPSDGANTYKADAFKEALAVRRQAERRQQRQSAIKVNNGFQEKSIDRIERPSMDIGLLRIKGYIQETGIPLSITLISAMDVDIKLCRKGGQPLGFRLSGGADFSFPLTVVRVALGGLADQAGLQAGDMVVKINGETIHHLRHEEVQGRLAKAGNEFTLSVVRNLKLKRAGQ